MVVNLKNSGVLAVGIFLAIGAVNSLSNTITGSYLFGGKSSASTRGSQETSPSSNKSKWKRPVDAEISVNYGVPGNMWVSGYHTGIDFPVPTGTTVRAASSGVVETAGRGGQYGNQVVIRHQEYLYSQYAHLSKVSVSPGEKVNSGQEIGLSGSTGNSSGPHLHFEMRTGPKYGSSINPSGFMKNAD